MKLSIMILKHWHDYRFSQNEIGSVCMYAFFLPGIERARNSLCHLLDFSKPTWVFFVLHYYLLPISTVSISLRSGFSFPEEWKMWSKILCKQKFVVGTDHYWRKSIRRAENLNFKLKISYLSSSMSISADLQYFLFLSNLFIHLPPQLVMLC